MTVVRTIDNPKLGLSAEIHKHRLNNPPPKVDPTVYYATVNGGRPAESEMRQTEDEAAQDGATAIGLPRNYVAEEKAAAGAKSKGK